MNVMLVAVTERIREIGIRKSVGAKPYDIRFQFLVEALLLSLAGAVIGILLGVAAGNLLAGFLKAELVFPLGWSIICVLICSGVGLASGVYSAQKAASLDPVEALRSE
jgi:putative ABC transport system permease protein